MSAWIKSWLFFGILFLARLSGAQSPSNTDVPGVRFNAPLYYRIPGGPLSMAATDVNGDGNLDLIVGALDLAFHVLLGNGNGSFRSEIRCKVPGHFWSFLSAGDLNGDGKGDVVLSSTFPGDSSVGIYFSAGDVTFSERFISVATGMATRQLPRIGSFRPVIGDFNQDKIPDVVLQDFISGGVAILFGHGDGSFRAAMNFAPGIKARTFAKGDFNGDAAADLALAGDDDTLKLVLRSHDETFTTIPSSTTVSRALGLAAADFNRDGLMDLASIHQHHSDISVLLNAGNASFKPPIRLRTGNLPMSIGTADLNGDGVADLVTANWQSSDVTVLLGMGDGKFLSSQSISVGHTPIDLVMGDFNADGLTDVASLGHQNEGVSILINRGTHPSRSQTGTSNDISQITSSVDSTVSTSTSPAFYSRAQYQISSWTTEEGLPQNTVKCILQTRDGYLWVGTQNGVARFDGRQFRVFDRTSTPDLPHCDVISLAEDAEGVVWLGTTQGLACFRNGRFSFYPLNASNDQPAEIWRIVVQPNRVLLLGTTAGPRLFQNGHFLRAFANVADRGAPRLLGKDSNGTVWLCGGESYGLARFVQDSAEPDIAYFYRPHAETTSIETFFLDSRNRAWFGGVHDLLCWDKGRIKIIPLSSGRAVTSVNEDRTGRLWIGTHDGLRLMKDDRLIAEYTVREGLSDHEITCIYPDREGNVWVGTRAGGLNCLKPRRVINYSASDGLASDDIWSVSETLDGSLLIGTSAGVSWFKNGTFVNYKVEPFPHPGGTRWVLEDSTRTVWAGGRAGLLRFNKGEFIPATETPAVSVRFLTTAYQDKDGMLWFGGSQYLFSLKSGTWKGHTISNWPSELPKIVGIIRDPSGDIWFGSENRGLFRMSRGTFSRITASDGLTSDYVAPVLAEADGTIWAASNKGLNRLKNGKITPYTTAEGLAENIVLNVLEDENGWFWLNGHRGIHRVRKQELNDLAEGKRKTVDMITYGTADGLLSSEGNGGSFPNSCKTRDGRLWFPTTKGLVMIDPSVRTRDVSAPPVWIERFRANDRILYEYGIAFSDFPSNATPLRIRGSDGSRLKLALAPGTGRIIQIDFTAPTFSAPERTKFKFRLEGYDTDWRLDEAERRAVYTNLRPGNYRFRVIASGREGGWNTTGDAIDFEIAPFFYQTYWFYALCAASIFVVASGFQAYRLRIQRRILRLEHTASVARERERIAGDLHDDLGASLSRIALLSQVARRELESPGKAASHIERIAEISSEVVDSISEVVWAANPKYDSLSSLQAYFREYAAGHLSELGINFHFEANFDLPDRRIIGECRRHLFLVFKEALNNVCKHAEASQIEISLRVECNNLFLSVSDNGRGIAPGPNDNYSHGISNMRERVAKLDGVFQLESAPGEGVRIFVKVPLQG